MVFYHSYRVFHTSAIHTHLLPTFVYHNHLFYIPFSILQTDIFTYIFYSYTCRRTSGSIIFHLWYHVRLFSHCFTSFAIQFSFGSTPANLYFHIRYFMHIFVSIYSIVASTVPISLPIRNAFLSTVHPPLFFQDIEQNAPQRIPFIVLISIKSEPLSSQSLWIISFVFPSRVPRRSNLATTD